LASAPTRRIVTREPRAATSWARVWSRSAAASFPRPSSFSPSA